jgi:hypothetical protein
MRSRLLCAVGLIVACTMFVDATAAEETGPETKVGRVEGTRAFIAMRIRDERVRVYVCNGTGKRLATISKWFTGRWDGRSATTLAHGRYELEIDEVVSDDGSVSGRLLGPGGAHRWSVAHATPPEGLYRRTRAEGARRPRGTWIALSARSVRGAMVDPRPRKCRVVAVSGPGGQVDYRVVC